QQREYHQQKEQIAQKGKLMTQMQTEPGKTGPIPETRERQLVEDNDCETGKRDRQRVPVKQRNTEQRQGEKNEIKRYSEDQNGFSQFGDLRRMRDVVPHQVHIKICDLQCASARKPRRLPGKSDFCETMPRPVSVFSCRDSTLP